MWKICKPRPRRGLTGILLILASGLPVLAWKTKLAATNSPHSKISEFAMNLVKHQYPETSAEVDRFRGTLSDACGWLNNDANAHGNVLWNNERWDPDDHSADPTTDPDPTHPKGYWAPINFNGGPFYRWWIRALQAEALCTSTFEFSYDKNLGGWAPIKEPYENGLEEWGRSFTGIRTEAFPKISAKRIYQYFGLMAHLIQDNSAPAHIANIRHGWWEGVEWWHDKSAWTLGGGGRDYPDWNKAFAMIGTNPPGTIVTNPDWTNGTIYGYFSSDSNSATKINDSLQITSIEGYLDGIISSNRAFFMPGLDTEDVKSWITARGLTDAEQVQLKAGENEFSTSLPFGLNPKAVYFSSGLGQNLVYTSKAPTLPGSPAISHGNGLGILVKGQWLSYSSGIMNLDWRNLNLGGTLWVPNKAYTGKAFDQHWGSHGGGLGFPNRDFPQKALLDMISDATSGSSPVGGKPEGRIFPGDLYLVHPYQNSTYTLKLQNIVGETIQGYRDERSWEAVDINPMLVKDPAHDEPPGAELLDRAGAWNAVFYEQVSEALPPMLARFAAVPRRMNPNQVDFASEPLPWFSGNLGAYLRIGFDTNRQEDHRVEVYAIPADQFSQVSTWQKNIKLGKPSDKAPAPGDLSESDLTVWDDFPTSPILPPGGPKSTTTPDINPFKGNRPPFDYGYQNLMGFPLKVAWGRKTLQQWNPTTTDVTSASQFDVPASMLTPQTDSNRLPWGFQRFLTWDGEVEDPAPLIPGSNAPGNYKADDFQGKKILPSGKYFLFVKIYKIGRHDAFARNQFKIQNTSKNVLEYSDWTGAAWTNDFVATARGNLANGVLPANFTMLPDELFPIRVDTRRPTAVVTVLPASH